MCKKKKVKKSKYDLVTDQPRRHSRTDEAVKLTKLPLQ